MTISQINTRDRREASLKEFLEMVDISVDLDRHRGMAAQKATELRRLRSEVERNRATLRLRQDELEVQLASGPARSWREAVEKARYLVDLLGDTPAGQDRRRQRIIRGLLEDFERLLALESAPDGDKLTDEDDLTPTQA